MKNTQNQKALSPFSCSYTPQLPELLLKLGCSIGISTYQAGKLIFISPKDENHIIQLPRTFAKPMGIALDTEKGKMALATKDEIITFRNSNDLARYYPKSPEKYDALFMPRATFHTGPLDIHDLNYGHNNTLYAVNTLFSCIVSINDDYNFCPVWKPPFIDILASEDRCHLNGMALKDGQPKYVTAFNRGNSVQSWRENITSSGIIIDVETDRLIAEGLPMPHSPRLYGNKLYVLLSATGELIEVDVDSGKHRTVIKLDGFVRGMDFCQDYLFIGLSKLRKNSSTFAKLDFAHRADQAGIVLVHLPTGSVAGKIIYQTSLDEIYDVRVFPGMLRPNILNTIKDDHKLGLMIPNATYWAKNKPVT